MERTSSPAVMLLPDEVTNEGLAALEKELERLVGADGTALVVDLGHTTFLSSGGLGLLVQWGKRLSERGGRIALVRPQAAIQRLLRSIGLETILPWFPDADHASAFVAGSTR